METLCAVTGEKLSIEHTTCNLNITKTNIAHLGKGSENNLSPQKVDNLTCHGNTASSMFFHVIQKFSRLSKAVIWTKSYIVRA